MCLTVATSNQQCQLTTVLFIVALFTVLVPVTHPVFGDTGALRLPCRAALEEVLWADTRQLSLHA